MSSSPRLGVVRKSMVTHPLLAKAPLGRSRTVPGLPGPDLRFVVSSLNGGGGVAEVLSSWRVQTRPGDPPRRPDFVCLNRDAVKAGVATSRELGQYRAWRGGASATGSSAHTHTEGGASRRALPVPEPDVTFGIRNRTPSPTSALLSHEYGRRWVNEQLSRNRTGKHQEQVRRGRGAQTRTSLLRTSKSLPSIQTPVIPHRYTQVGPALDTFRDRVPRSRRSGSGSRTEVQD